MKDIDNKLSFELLLQAAPDALIVVNNKNGKIEYVNTQTEKLFGYNKKELLNKTIEILIPPTQREQHVKHRNAYSETPQPRRMGSNLSLQGLKKNGEIFPCDVSLSPFNTKDGQYVFAAIRDMTQQKKTEADLESIALIAHHDSLTNLLNRTSFEEALRYKIKHNNKNNIFVVFIDVDDFKEINDTFGHPAGDKALCWVAKQLKATLRKTDLLSRFGGDEFVVALMNINAEKDAITIANKIVKNIKKSFKFKNKTLHVSASVGIAHCMKNDDVDALIERSDMAMYKAKKSGKDHCEVAKPQDLYMSVLHNEE